MRVYIALEIRHKNHGESEIVNTSVFKNKKTAIAYLQGYNGKYEVSRNGIDFAHKTNEMQNAIIIESNYFTG